MSNQVVKGFNVNGSTVQYDYESLADRILKSSIGNEYSSLSAYKVDDYVLYAGQLYRCIIDITTPQDFDSSKWEAVSAGSDLKWLKKYYSINDEIKQALLDCFAHCAWTDEHGQEYYDALETALYRTAGLDYITAVFNQGLNVIYDTDSLDTLKQYLTVTAYYDDGTSGTVTGYTLSGTLTEGTSTITVNYSGKTDTFDVTVTHRILPNGYKLLKYIYGDGNAYWGDNSALNIGDTVHVIAEQTEADTSVNRIACGTANSSAWIALCVFFSDGNVGAYYGTTSCKVALQNVNDGPVEFTTRLTSSAIEVTAKNQYGELQNTAAKTGMVAGTYFRLFWYGSSTSIFKGRIYFSEQLNSSMVALKKLYPCLRESDNAVGLYDVVSNSFHQSETSTPFIAGPAA